MSYCLSEIALTDAEVAGVARPGESWASARQRAERLRANALMCRLCTDRDSGRPTRVGMAFGWIDDDRYVCPSCRYGMEQCDTAAQAVLLAEAALVRAAQWQSILAYRRLSHQAQLRQWLRGYPAVSSGELAVPAPSHAGDLGVDRPSNDFPVVV